MNYAHGPYSVIFPANHTHAPLHITITNDVLLGHKMFNLTINTSSLPSHINASNPFQVPVTIVDDDGNHLILLYINMHVCVHSYIATSLSVTKIIASL